MWKRILSVLLTLTLVLGLCPVTRASAKSDTDTIKVAYIPLDQRPFNDLRVRTMATSLNIDLVMPDEDLYTTRLDNQELNENGTQCGDREALFQWLQEQDRECDVFLLSLDQLLSGGLMSSRTMSQTEDLDFELSIIDYIYDLSQNNQVYIIDSVLRLATSVDFDGFSLDDYYAFRAYGEVARPQLTGEYLTVENIVDTYRFAADGSAAITHIAQEYAETLLDVKTPSTDTILADQLRQALEITAESPIYNTLRTNLPTEAENSVLKEYLQIRERKLKLTDYALTKLSGVPNIHYLLGVDDSSDGDNIQSNELRLFQQKLIGEDDQILSSLDGLAQVAISKIFLGTHSLIMPNVSVTYYGEQENIVQGFNCYTPADMVDQTLAYFGANQVAEDKDPDLAVIVVTPTSQNFETLMIQLVSQLNEYQNKEIPTILVDMSSGKMRKYSDLLTDNVNLGMLLSFSGSNELPNNVTMGISQGIARYAALTLKNFLTDEMQAAHLSNLAMAYTMEFAYQKTAYKVMNDSLEALDIPSGNFGTLDKALLNQVEIALTKQIAIAAADLVENLENSPYISSLAPYSLSGVEQVTITNCTYPMLRNLELGCEPVFTLSKAAASLGTFHEKYINGMTETTFQPDGNITREQAVVMLVRTLSEETTETAAGCPEDVSQWAWSSVQLAKKQGFLKGYPDGTLRGQNSITRAEFCSLIVQFAQIEGITLSQNADIQFTDVPQNSGLWYVEPIYTMARAGLVVGFAGLFRPEDPITRAEAVTVLNRLWNRQETLSDSFLSTSRFSDVTAQWQLPQIQESSISHFCK